jgi:glycine cleavage system transcriptional repressor
LKNLIITATGFDRPGIVSEISGVITTHGGNVEESRMSQMGSDFAIIMLVSVSREWEESMEVALHSINNLTIITKNTEAYNPSDFDKYQITLQGADNEGIVKVLSEYLAEKSINIIEMNTLVSPAPVTGTPLFNLDAIILLSPDLIIEKIHANLEEISQKLGVKILLDKSKSEV